MLVRIKTYGVTVAITLVCVLIISQTTYAQPYACLPTCDGGDARFFVFSGPNLSSFIETNYAFGINSPDGATNVELGIFDGDDGTSQGGTLSSWDDRQGNIRMTLYADPMGIGATDIQLAQWSGDGSFGNNTGTPMPDDDWINFIVPNNEQARGANGNFRYTLVIDSQDTVPLTRNQFKIRTDGSMAILPLQEFAFMSQPFTLDDQLTVWPNIVFPDDFNNPACWDPVLSDFVCQMQDPGCCTSGGPYDGGWKFFIEVGEGQGVFNAWDGDFDFGSASGNNLVCNIADGVNVDTDDWNTPPGVPDFAIGTGAVPQGISTPTDPPDDLNCNNGAVFHPSVVYDVITPMDEESFTNENPSGNQEWELYNIGSVPDVDVPRPGDIPAGIWTFMVRGLDFGNLNGLRFDFPVLAVNENGEPVPFNSEEEGPRVVPTLNEWGMLGFVIFALITSVFFLRNRRFKHADK